MPTTSEKNKKWHKRFREKYGYAQSSIWAKKNPEKRRAQAKRYRERYPEKKSAMDRAWAEAHPEQIKNRHAKWRALNPDKVLDSYLKTRFKITLLQYNELFSRQNGLCAICKRAQSTKGPLGYPKRLCVDHCHKSGKVRALLCDRCNTSLGHLEESIELIQSLANYILQHREDKT